MHSSGSLYRYAIEMVRANVNEVAADAKFDDVYISRFFVHPACSDVLQRVTMNSTNRIVVRHRITTVLGQEHYILPPHVGQVIRIAVLDENGIVQQEAMPRGEFNPCGPGWALEGTTLTIRPFPASEDIAACDVWFIPNADVAPHYADGGGTAGYTTAFGVMSSSTTFKLAAAPIIGDLDLRDNAYAGYVLRVLSSTDHTLVQERIISSYARSTRICTLRSAFGTVVTNSPDKQLAYEVIPIWSLAAWDTIAWQAACRIAAARNLSGSKKDSLTQMFGASMKTLRDGFANAQGRTGKTFERNTVDNPDLAEGNWPLAYGVPGRVVS